MGNTKTPPTSPTATPPVPSPRKPAANRQYANRWRWIQLAITLLSVVAAGGALANEVPIARAMLILIVGVAVAGMTAAAEKMIRNRAALIVLQWAVVLVVVSACVAVIVELFLPCTLPAVGKAMGHDCGPNPLRSLVVTLRADADRADAQYRSRGELPNLSQRAVPQVLESCRAFSNVDSRSLPNADLSAEVHLNIARMCSKAAVLLLEQKGAALSIEELSKRAISHARYLSALYEALKKRGDESDLKFLDRSRRNWASAFYFEALSSRVLQCNTPALDQELRQQLKKDTSVAWKNYIVHDPGSVPEDKLLIDMMDSKEADPCAP